MELSNWLSLAAIIVALTGWIYQLGVMSGRVSRNEVDTKVLEERMRLHHENTTIHVTEEWRNEIKANLARMESKVDELPCRMPGCKRID